MANQYEILDFLKTNNANWYTTKDLIDTLQCSSSNLSTKLKKLRRGEMILFRDDRVFTKRGLHSVRYYKYKEMKQ